MAEHKRATPLEHEKVEQKRRLRQQDSEPLFEQLHGWDQGLLSLTETTFYPQMDQHAAFLASAPAGQPPTNLVLHLQQTYGNRYVQRLVESMKVQAKLAVSALSDVYEQEADRVAKAVTKPADSQIQRLEEELQAKPLLQRQPEEEEEEVQTQSAESQPTAVSDNVETRINNARGSGQSLSDVVREPMEQAFAADFSGVRVHTNSEADLLNQQLSARAFTTGQDIFFRQGEYSPESSSGKGLIAHELTHVVQQSAAPALRQQVATASKPATREDAIAKVDEHIVPRDCFIKYHGTRRGWQPISGTGCAHWVAHEKNITIGYKCDRGFSVRTGKLGKPGVITGKDKYSLQEAKVGDIWASSKLKSHVGIVRDVRKDKESGKVIEVQIEHDSSEQGGVVKDSFKEGEFYR